MSEQNQTAVITGPAIDLFRLSVIEKGLKLETLGMKHSTNSVRKAAQSILTQNGIKPKRDRKALYEQFKAYRADVMNRTNQTN